MSALPYVIWVLVFPQFQNLYVMCLVLLIEDCSSNLHLADSTIKKPLGRINDVIILQIGIMFPQTLSFLVLIAIRLAQLYLVDHSYVPLAPSLI